MKLVCKKILAAEILFVSRLRGDGIYKNFLSLLKAQSSHLLVINKFFNRHNHACINKQLLISFIFFFFGDLRIELYKLLLEIFCPICIIGKYRSLRINSEFLIFFLEMVFSYLPQMIIVPSLRENEF